MSVHSAKQKALYVICRRVSKKFPHYTHNQMWAVTYSIYNKATKQNEVKVMNNDNKYGECERCGEPLIAEDLYIDYERDKMVY